MKEFLKKNRSRIIVAIIAALFSVYVINGIIEYNIIPDHIHSIDDKAPEDRTDEDNITILQRSLQKDPDNILIMIELSDLFEKTDDAGSAQKTLRKILEIDPLNEDAKKRLQRLDK